MDPSVACQRCHHLHPRLVLHKRLSGGFHCCVHPAATEARHAPLALPLEAPGTPSALTPAQRRTVCLLACWCGALPVRPVGLPSPWPLADRAAQAHYPFLPICNWYPRWPGSPNKLKFTWGRQEAGMGVRMSTLFGFKNIKPKQFIKF